MSAPALASTQLSTMLREGTAVAHSQAETATFMDRLVGGQANAQAWTDLAIQLYPVYQALESAAAEFEEHPLVAPIYDPALNRAAELARDLEALLGEGATDRIGSAEFPLLPATKAYVAALSDNPTAEAVVANHYVRYLGDMSGGQIIATMLRRHYDIADEALNFYRFPEIPKLKLYKDAYRANLDELPADEETKARILDEAVAAFGYNQALFLDLAQAETDRLAG